MNVSGVSEFESKEDDHMVAFRTSSERSTAYPEESQRLFSQRRSASLKTTKGAESERERVREAASMAADDTFKFTSGTKRHLIF